MQAVFGNLLIRRKIGLGSYFVHGWMARNDVRRVEGIRVVFASPAL